MTVRDRLGEVFDDADLVAGSGVRGQPGVVASQLTMMTVLHRAENLTDRQAAEAGGTSAAAAGSCREEPLTLGELRDLVECNVEVGGDLADRLSGLEQRPHH